MEQNLTLRDIKRILTLAARVKEKDPDISEEELNKAVLAKYNEGGKLAYEILDPLDIPFENKALILKVIVGTNGWNYNISRNAYYRKSAVELPKDFYIPATIEELEDMMVTINRMVKDPSCPKPVKNRFYDEYKSSFLRRMVRMGRVTDIWDQGDVYSMTVDGKYVFHQPKRYYEGMDLDIVGSQPYENRDTSVVPYDQKLFDKFCIAWYYFDGVYKREKELQGGEPKL